MKRDQRRKEEEVLVNSHQTNTYEKEKKESSSLFNQLAEGM